ncbi:unnamed protein product [Calypogeia fissa]
MGLLGSPPNGVGGNFFFFAPGPEPVPAKGSTGFESLALNVLRSLQFSYMMMKGFRSTSRALRDLDFFQDEGGMFGDGPSGGRWSSSNNTSSSTWRPVGKVGSGCQRVGRIGTHKSRLSIGKTLGEGNDGAGVRNGRGSGGAGRRTKCTGDNVGNIISGEGNLEGKGQFNGGPGAGISSECRGSKRSHSGNGAPTGNTVEGKGIKGTPGGKGATTSGNIEGQGCEGTSGGKGATSGKVEGQGIEGTPGGSGVNIKNFRGKGREGTPLGSGDGTKFGDVNTSGGTTTTTTTSSITYAEGANGPFIREGSSAASGMVIGNSGVQAEGSALVSNKFIGGLTNRTLAVAGLGAVDSISNQLKPMKGFMKSVKMATGVMSGVKTATGVIQRFQAPAGGVLIGFGAANGVVVGFETARMIIKAGKISKDFASVWKSTRAHLGVGDITAGAAKANTRKLLKGLKASDGALTLVKLTKEFAGGVGSTVQGGLSNWDLVSKSYDLSNSVVKVFEAVLGLKGGGMIGLVGKGFVALKGAVGGLGLSVKLVKAVVVSKEISILLLKGFGISKTAIEAFKASQDGKRMLKWLIFKDPADQLNNSSKASLKGRTDARAFEILKTCAQQPPAASQGTSPSLMYSLASLLFARFEAFDTCDPAEDGLTSSSTSPSYIFFLSLPS